MVCVIKVRKGIRSYVDAIKSDYIRGARLMNVDLPQFYKYGVKTLVCG